MHVMVGGIVAPNLATTLKDTRRRAIVTTYSAAAGSAVVGAASSVLADPAWRPVALTRLVAVTFLAVWVRRFGPRWFTAGCFVVWQAHFFGLFSTRRRAPCPASLLAAVISTAWVGLLLVTILARDPRPPCSAHVTALRAQARFRSSAPACLDVLADPAAGPPGALRAHLIKTSGGRCSSTAGSPMPQACPRASHRCVCGSGSSTSDRRRRGRQCRRGTR